MSKIVLAIAFVLAITAYRASIRTSLVIVVGTVLFVPSLLTIPGLGSSVITVQRLAMLALLINLIGRVRSGDLPVRIFEVTPVHAVFLVFLGVSFVLGVGLAQPNVDVTGSSHIWA